MCVMEERLYAKDKVELVSAFMENVKDDPRINTSHISLYVSLVTQWFVKCSEGPLSIFSKEIMPICKISGTAAYHKSIRQLHEYGYIKYVPSYNHFLGSLVYF